MPFIPAGSPPPSTASAIFTVTQQAGILAGTGITAINSLTGAVQTLANSISGTTPAFSSTGTTHTLNIPLASTASVTAGLISKTEYDVFNAKQNAITGAATTITTSDLTANKALISNASGKVAVSSSTVGYSLATLTDPNAITYLRVNADNSVTPRTPAEVVTDLGIATMLVLNKDMAGASAVNTTANTQLFSAAISANLLQVNDFLELFTQVSTTVTNGNTLNVRVYLNNANNLTGATLLGTFTNVVGTGNSGFMRNFFITAIGASGNIRGYGSAVNATSQYTLNNAAMTNTTINTTVNNWIILAVQMSGATFTTTLQGSIVKLTR
jgi:hypothetical protein